MIDAGRVRAITLDLDDTLWPVWPAIERAERVLHDWLAVHAPAVAARFDPEGLRLLRDRVGRDHPEWAHDFSRLRHRSLAIALADCGCDEGLADAAYEVFFDERNRLELFAEAEAALAQLASRWPLLALTNGNADLQRAGVARYFTGCVAAREVGVGKPDPRIFAVACERLGLPPQSVLHVGDDWALDVEGALQAGLQAAWVSRSGLPAPGPGVAVLPDLAALVRALGREAQQP